MKTVLLFINSVLLSILCFSQTAINFTCNDCNGISHDLFSELDSGKIIVLCWVMPCASCVAPAIASADVVQSFATSNPDKVFMYLCDDYGNTSCSALTSWASLNGLPKMTKFSDSSIVMTDYGTEGMPKIVVLGGSNHAVFYNASNSIDNTDSLQYAISTAIAASSGIAEKPFSFTSLQLFPNPAKNNTILSFSSEKPETTNIDIYNLSGKKISTVFSGKLYPGKSVFKINTSELHSGIYFIKLDDFRKTKLIKLLVSH